MCALPRDLAHRWARDLAQTGTLTSEQAASFHRAICERYPDALARLAESLNQNPDQLKVFAESLRQLDPYYKVERGRGLATWANWAIVGAALAVVGLAISAETTGFFEPGGGRYQNRRRAIGTRGGGPGFGGGGARLLNDSLILVDEFGTRKVQDLEAGDDVLALDLRSGEPRRTSVTRILKGHPREFFYSVNHELSITNDHPVLVLRNGSSSWVEVERLVIGDTIKSPRGLTVVRTISRMPMPAVTVYLETELGNFVVKGKNGDYVVKANYRPGIFEEVEDAVEPGRTRGGR